MLVSASPTARRAFAQGHRFTVVAVETRGGYGTVRDRDLPLADHLIARDHTGYGTVANGDQEGFLCHRRQVQHAVDRFCNGDALAIQRWMGGLGA